MQTKAHTQLYNCRREEPPNNPTRGISLAKSEMTASPGWRNKVSLFLSETTGLVFPVLRSYCLRIVSEELKSAALSSLVNGAKSVLFLFYFAAFEEQTMVQAPPPPKGCPPSPAVHGGSLVLGLCDQPSVYLNSGAPFGQFKDCNSHSAHPPVFFVNESMKSVIALTISMIRCPHTAHFSAVCWNPEYCKTYWNKHQQSAQTPEWIRAGVIRHKILQELWCPTRDFVAFFFITSFCLAFGSTFMLANSAAQEEELLSNWNKWLNQTHGPDFLFPFHGAGGSDWFERSGLREPLSDVPKLPWFEVKVSTSRVQKIDPKRRSWGTCWGDLAVSDTPSVQFFK